MAEVIDDTIRHLCFDKDGTLIDVHSYWAHITRLRAERIIDTFALSKAAKNVLISSMGVDPDTGKIRLEGPVGRKPRPQVIAGAILAISECMEEESEESRRHELARQKRLTELFAEIDRYQQEFDDYSIVPLPGAVDFVCRAHAAGYLLSVFSSDRRANIRKTLERIGLTGMFTVLVGGDDVSRGKPDPEGFLSACDQIGVPLRASLYVGDTSEDLLMAKKANGLHSIGVTTGLGNYAELKQYSPNIYEILSAIDLAPLSGAQL